MCCKIQTLIGSVVFLHLCLITILWGNLLRQEELLVYLSIIPSTKGSKQFTDCIILGMNINEKQKIYNSLLVVNNDLNVLQKYHKNKLVPFGEFLPFENLLSNLGFKKITQGYQSFSADNRRNLIKINNYSFINI